MFLKLGHLAWSSPSIIIPATEATKFARTSNLYKVHIHIDPIKRLEIVAAISQLRITKLAAVAVSVWPVSICLKGSRIGLALIACV